MFKPVDSRINFQTKNKRAISEGRSICLILVPALPFTHLAKKIDQVDREKKDMGQSYMIQENVIKNLLHLSFGVAKQFRVSMRCPKSRFPIRIIVFDEPELIIFVSQGLTLSTASLVYIFFQASSGRETDQNKGLLELL